MTATGRLRVGLTGGIASGKSTVSARLRARGVTVCDADEIAHRLSAPGAAGSQALAARLGPEVLDARGAVDRIGLRRRLFADSRLRREVEAVLHPLILTELANAADAAAGPYVVLAIPLLFEAGLQAQVSRVLVVDCPPELQRSRLASRDGGDPEDIARLLASQLDRAGRLAGADDVLLNEADLACLHAATDELDVFYLRLAATGSHRETGRRLPRSRSRWTMAP